MKLPASKYCENCAKLFQPKHAKGRFCSSKCRLQWHRKKNKANLSEFNPVKEELVRESKKSPLNQLKNPIKLRVIGLDIEDVILMQNIIQNTFFPHSIQSTIKRGRNGNFLQYFDIEKTD